MAYTFNSIGTTYLGVGTPTEDGWREATLWFVLLGLPIIPLKHQVIRPVGETEWMNGSSTKLEIAETGFPHLGKVLVTYIIYWCIHLPVGFGPIVLSLWKVSGKPPSWSFWGQYGVWVAMVSVAWAAIYIIGVGHWSERRMKPVEPASLGQ